MGDLANVRLDRPSQWANKLRVYRAFLDGRHVGEIGDGGTMALTAAPGCHTLEIGLDWRRSQRREFEVNPGDCAVFRCSCWFVGWRCLLGPLLMWRTLFVRGGYICLDELADFRA